MSWIKRMLKQFWKIWFQGFKVFCDYLALTVIVGFLYGPIIYIGTVVKEKYGIAILVVLSILLLPLLFSGFSRYLRLLNRVNQ